MTRCNRLRIGSRTSACPNMSNASPSIESISACSGAAAECQALGVAGRLRPCTALVRPGQAHGSPRSPRAGLRLVRRRLRHAGHTRRQRCSISWGNAKFSKIAVRRPARDRDQTSPRIRVRAEGLLRVRNVPNCFGCRPQKVPPQGQVCAITGLYGMAALLGFTGS